MSWSIEELQAIEFNLVGNIYIYIYLLYTSDNVAVYLLYLYVDVYWASSSSICRSSTSICSCVKSMSLRLTHFLSYSFRLLLTYLVYVAHTPNEPLVTSNQHTYTQHTANTHTQWHRNEAQKNNKTKVIVTNCYCWGCCCCCCFSWRWSAS